jgi:hypothetical protein
MHDRTAPDHEPARAAGAGTMLSSRCSTRWACLRPLSYGAVASPVNELSDQDADGADVRNHEGLPARPLGKAKRRKPMADSYQRGMITSLQRLGKPVAGRRQTCAPPSSQMMCPDT